MNIKFYILLIGCLLFVNQQSYCQITYRIKGTVADSRTFESIIGANVSVDGIPTLFTDTEGTFELQLTEGVHYIKSSFIGYESVEKKINFTSKATSNLVFYLKTQTSLLDEIVISGNRSGRKVSEESKSVEVLNNALISNSNPIKVSDVLTKVAGVYMLDGQVNMRGGTGFTYGAGSRVQLIVDDLPMMTADRGDTKWEFVPMENTEQIEVLKGAASVMYGSSALNGVVNIKTAWPTPNQPETKYSVTFNPILSPKNELNKWWNTTPISKNFTGLHKQKIGNIDLVIGYAASTLESHLQGELNDFGRFNVKTRVHNKKIKGLTYGLNLNANIIKTQLYFLWASTTAYPSYLPYGGNADNPSTSIRRFRYLWYSIDPHATYYTKNGGRHSYRGRLYSTNFLDFTSFKMNNQAYIFQNEYQYSKDINKIVSTVVGGSANWFKVMDGTLGNHSGFKSAIFAQLSGKHKWLNFSLGGRIEGVANDTLATPLPPVFEGGLTIRLRHESFIRIAAGQGFRMPSLAEMYVYDNVGSLKIFPNEKLLPERGWNAEIAYKKGFTKNQWKGFIDVALYVTETKSLTEFTFNSNWTVPYQGGTVSGFGFRSTNLEKSRIAGIDISTQAKGNINKIPLLLIGGFTYAFPADLSNGSELNDYQKFIRAAVYAFDKQNEKIKSQIMLYRYRHIARIDIESGYKKLTFGGSVNYYSGVEKVDPTFLFFLSNLNTYLTDNSKGNYIFLARVGYKISPHHALNMVFNNVNNEEFASRPTKMDAPSNISIQYRVQF